MAEPQTRTRPNDKTWLQMTETFERLGIEPTSEEILTWWDQEDSLEFMVGCPNWRDRPALMMLIGAARSLCGMAPTQDIRGMVEMALVELEDRPS